MCGDRTPPKSEKKQVNIMRTSQSLEINSMCSRASVRGEAHCRRLRPAAASDVAPCERRGPAAHLEVGEGLLSVAKASGQRALRDDTSEGQHGKAAVEELGRLVLILRLGGQHWYTRRQRAKRATSQRRMLCRDERRGCFLFVAAVWGGARQRDVRVRVSLSPLLSARDTDHTAARGSLSLPSRTSRRHVPMASLRRFLLGTGIRRPRPSTTSALEAAASFRHSLAPLPALPLRMKASAASVMPRAFLCSASRVNLGDSTLGAQRTRRRPPGGADDGAGRFRDEGGRIGLTPATCRGVPSCVARLGASFSSAEMDASNGSGEAAAGADGAAAAGGAVADDEAAAAGWAASRGDGCKRGVLPSTDVEPCVSIST